MSARTLDEDDRDDLPVKRVWLACGGWEDPAAPALCPAGCWDGLGQRKARRPQGQVAAPKPKRAPTQRADAAVVVVLSQTT
jgi:hypothetical protein